MAMSCTTLVSSTLSSTTPRHRRDICRGSHTLGPSSTPRRGGGRSKATSHGTHTESASGFQGQTLGKAVEKLLGTYGLRRQKPGGRDKNAPT